MEDLKYNEKDLDFVNASIKSLLPLEELVYDCKNEKIKEIMSKEQPPFEYGPSSYAVGPVYFEDNLDLGDGDFYIGEAAND